MSIIIFSLIKSNLIFYNTRTLLLISILIFKLSIKFVFIIIFAIIKISFNNLLFIYVIIIINSLILYITLSNFLIYIDNIIFEILIFKKNF